MVALLLMLLSMLVLDRNEDDFRHAVSREEKQIKNRMAARDDGDAIADVSNIY